MNKKNQKYYIALTGAKKNVGDFLITSRSLALLKNIAPEYNYVLYPHWNELKDIDLVNKSEGIIILGGPGFQMNMYPGVYKLVKNLQEIKVPIYTLGSGWKGVPGDRTTEKLYQFNKSSKELLNNMEATLAGISCRDYQTERTLKNNGYKNINMTGCPVWYDLDSIGKKFIAPEKIKKLVYTPAQSEDFSDQSIEVLKYLKNKYNKAEIFVSFHRGIGVTDEYTPKHDAENTKKIADFAESIGANVVDVSFDDKKLEFYSACDLHIGYRVHAHIYFLSKRLPSILLHEDGRGNGVSEALNSPGIDAYKVSKIYSKIFAVFKPNKKLASLYARLGLKNNRNIIRELNDEINNLEKTKYKCFENTSAFIDEHYKIMENFIREMVYEKGA